MMPPLVSVIIPAYNYGSYISQTLDSIREQTYDSWECIVVDDGSTDDTREIVASYSTIDFRIKLITQINQGPASARNAGLKVSCGKYIQFLDADDLLEADKIECHLRFLESNPDIDIAYGSTRYFKLDNLTNLTHSMQDQDKPWMPNISGGGKELLLVLVRQNIMVVSAPLLRRRVIEDVGEFDICLPPLEDWDYWFRCALHGKRFQYIEAERTLSLIRWHPNSLSKNTAKMDKQLRLLRKKIDKICQELDILLINRKYASTFEGHKGLEKVQAGNLLSGIQFLFRAGLMCPKLREKIKWFYLCGIAPLCPPKRFLDIAYLPVSASLLSIFRYKNR